MKAIRELLKDRRRSQRGSVLSGVLIMTAFIAIISGALMTELSANFLLSNTMINRVAYQATDNSAIELALSRLQTTQLNAPCPALPTATVNNLTASATYLSCWPANRETSNGTALGSGSAPFNLDGAQIQANGFHDYVVANSSGYVFDYRFGTTAPRWVLQLNGTLTAPPLVIPNPSSGNQAIDVFPMTGGACSSSTNCVKVMSDSNSNNLSPQCTILGNGPIVSQPASSPTYGGYVYYSDGASLTVNDISGGDCDPVSPIAPYGNQPVVAGPIAIKCTSCSRVSDQVYVVVSDGASSRLVRSSFTGGRLSVVDNVLLPWNNATGIAASGSGVPASLAITFAGGGIALVQLNSSGGMGSPATYMTGGISRAPYWCAPCGNLLGVGGQDGVLYLFDSALNLIASNASQSFGSPINTSPTADGAGNWYAGTDDGKVHELQRVNGPTLSERETYAQMGAFGSSPQLGGCVQGICIYLGAQDGNVYLMPLDARKAVISACITTSPPTCSGVNPRLWASVEVGANSGPQTVHVQGWSYYSG